MKKENSKRMKLIDAILSKDKKFLIEVLQENKPEKIISTFSTVNSSLIEYEGKSYSGQEMDEIIKELKQNFNVHRLNFVFPEGE